MVHNENKLTTATHDIEESHKFNVEWGKLVTKEYIYIYIYYSIYMKFKTKQNPSLDSGPL